MLDAKLLKPQSLMLTETGLTGTLIIGTFEKRVPGYLCFTRSGASHLEVRHGRHRFRRFFIFFLVIWHVHQKKNREQGQIYFHLSRMFLFYLYCSQPCCWRIASSSLHLTEKFFKLCFRQSLKYDKYNMIILIAFFKLMWAFFIVSVPLQTSSAL